MNPCKAIKFSDSQSETQIVNLKDKKTITCEATPDGLSYSWFYNGDRISTTSELQTADFTKDSSGVYTCRVDNSLGTAQNIEPNAAEEKDFQTSETDLLLRRLKNKTYLMESGWEIIRKMGHPNIPKSVFTYKTGYSFYNFRYLLRF